MPSPCRHSRKALTAKSSEQQDRQDQQVEEKKKKEKGAARSLGPLAGPLDRYIDRIFENADSNKDGSISTSETYELVLKMYVQINRRAPISPPTRERVAQLFCGSDADKSGRLDRDEFRSLALTLASRATARVVTHKAVTMFGAPLLAVEVVRTLSGRGWVRALGQRAVPASERLVGANVAGLIGKEEFWRMALTVALVATLGNAVMGVLNSVLDALGTTDDDDDDDNHAVDNHCPVA